VQPPSPPPAASRPARRPHRVAKKKKPVRKRAVKQAARRQIPTLHPEQASSTDGLLLVGGLALFVLVLADTVFLTVSRRALSS
jgi:hypothetical protein